MVHDPRSMWRSARVVANRAVANGSMWLELEADDDLPVPFEPGNVLGLGIRLNDDTVIRHAYTVSRCNSSLLRFEHLYRVVSGGRLSPRLARLAAADSVLFHGPFHLPIRQEVRPDAERIVLISTGAGIGPIFGYAEKTLTDGEARSIILFAGFRKESDACLSDELTTLSCRHPNFEWHFTLSQPARGWNGLKGRVTESVPACLDKIKLDTMHFHLVGNGEMVHLMRNALYQSGVTKERVSIETYFNHYAQPLPDAVAQLASRLKPNSTFQS